MAHMNTLTQAVFYQIKNICLYKPSATIIASIFIFIKQIITGAAEILFLFCDRG